MTNAITTQDSHSLPVRRSARVHPLVWILVVGAVLRAGLWFAWNDWSPLINGDAQDYHALALRLATTAEYANEAGQLISLRPPMYPAIVAASYLAFGLENDHAVRAIQAVIGLLLAVIVYRLGVMLFSRPVALWAAALVCFYPSLLGYANLLLSETVFTFFVVAFIWLVCEAVQRQRISVLILAGIAMGLAALTRSILLLFAPILAVWLVWSWRGPWSQRLLAAVLPLAVFAAVVAPWAVRNTRVQQTFTIIDVMGGRNAMMGNYEYTPLERSWATISIVPEEHQWYRVLQDERAAGPPITQGQLDKLALHHAIQFVLNHPYLTLKRDLVKFFNFWQLDRLFVAAASEGYFGSHSTVAQLVVAAITCGSYAFVLFAGIFGISCQPPIDWRYHTLLIASIVFPCAIHTLIFAHSRYCLPIVPLLCLYAAAAIVHRQAVWAQRRSWGFRIASILCLIAVLGWSREFLFVDWNFISHGRGSQNAVASPQGESKAIRNEILASATTEAASTPCPRWEAPCCENAYLDCIDVVLNQIRFREELIGLNNYARHLRIL